MRAMRRPISTALFIALFVLTSILQPIPMVAGSEPLHYVALGDSIATGTVDYWSSITPYVNHFHSYLETAHPDAIVTLTNHATDGDRSHELLDKLRTDANIREAVETAHVITISIGGNNLMRAATIPGFTEVDWTMAEEYTQDFEGRDGQPGHWHDIVDALRTLNSSAKVIVLTIFNPYNSSPSWLYRDDRGLFEAVEPYLARINGTIQGAAVDGDYAVADAHAAYLAYQPGSMGSVTYMYPPWYQYAFRNPHPKALGQQIITDLHVTAYESFQDEEPPPPLYTLTLVSEGEASGAGSYTANTVVPVSTTVPAGYTFVSWTDGGVPVSHAPAFDYTMPAAHTTLRAGFDPIPYTVTFESNGGSAVEPQTVYHGDLARRPEDPTREEYTFTGWFLDGAEFDFNTPIAGDITLYAAWQEGAALPEMTVNSITYSTSGPHLNVAVSVTSSGSPVANATVDAVLSCNGEPLTSFTVTTGSSGTATYRYNRAPSGAYTTQINLVQAEGYTWDGGSPENGHTKR